MAVPTTLPAITGTDPRALTTALGTLIPELYKTRGMPMPDEPLPLLNDRHGPSTAVALDVVDFMAQHTWEPTQRRQHQQHEHFEFDQYSSHAPGSGSFATTSS